MKRLFKICIHKKCKHMCAKKSATCKKHKKRILEGFNFKFESPLVNELRGLRFQEPLYLEWKPDESVNPQTAMYFKGAPDIVDTTHMITLRSFIKDDDDG